ncbi:MAG: PH domain-containing protein [Planctomycetota bacterium]
MPEESGEQVLIETHPSMWRQHPLYFLLCILLVPVLIGLVALVVWWLECLSTALTVTEKRTILRRGLLSRHTTEVRHEDVRTIEVHQGLLQRMLGTGSLSIGSAGHGGVEIRVRGLPEPQVIARMIRARQ